MTAPVLLVALSSAAQMRLRQDAERLLASFPDTRIILLTGQDAMVAPDRVAEVWHDGDRRGAGAFLARMRRLSWAGFGAVYDFDATFFTKFMRICLWPRPKWHVWPFLTCSNRASNL